MDFEPKASQNTKKEVASPKKSIKIRTFKGAA